MRKRVDCDVCERHELAKDMPVHRDSPVCIATALALKLTRSGFTILGWAPSRREAWRCINAETRIKSHRSGIVTGSQWWILTEKSALESARVAYDHATDNGAEFDAWGLVK
jgi:hypothetical protein